MSRRKMVNNPLTKTSQHNWRQETAFVYSSQPHCKLTPGWASPTAGFVGGPSSFTLQSVGGAVFLQDYVPGAQPGRGIHWQIENSSTGALHLTEFTVHGGAIGPRITVEAPSQLFPALAVTRTSDGRLLLAGLFSNGFLLCIRLGISSFRDAILAGLSAEMLHGLNLTQPLGPLTAPTSLAATAEAVVIGGSSGSVLCVPLPTLEDGNISHCFELRDNSWALTKLISGVLYRPRQPAVLACVPVVLAQRQLLLVLYDDCALRVFNPGRRQHVATLELETQVAISGQTGSAADSGGRQRSNGSRQLVPTYIAAESPQHTAPAGAAHIAAGESHHGGGSELTLVVEFEAPDTLSRHTYAYTLSSSAGGRLALSNSVELKQQEAGVVVLEARVSGDTIWLLVRSQGWGKVLGFERNSGEKTSNALLADSASERAGSLIGAAGNSAEVDQELWECLLEAFPEHLSAEAQVCQAMLVPSQTCRASLREALSDHGTSVSPLEVENAPFAKLQSWMREAVLNLQLRMPSASVPECWLSFLATYRKHWACQHPPLGLVLHRGSPEWLGLARGGGMLCMLRPSAFVELLTTRLRLRGDVDDLHHCAVEAGALLGPLVQEACLVLLVAGVDPLERLIPRLCETLHRGPSTASGGGGSGMGACVSSGGPAGGTRTAVLTDSAREAQQQWRQRRLQVIVTIGQRLGSHTSLIDSMSAYLDAMNQSTPEPYVSIAPGGGDGALASGNAATAFLVSTGRQICRAVAIAALHAALLLGLAVQQGALGTAPLAREVLVELEGTLLPFVCELLQRAALGLWLTETPSSKDEAADMEPALSALKHLRLGSKSRQEPEADVPSAGAAQRKQLSFGSGGAAGTAAAEAAATAPSSLPSGDISLAARLVPAFFTGCGNVQLDLLGGPEVAGHFFTLYLQYGGIAGRQLKIPVAARILQLGCKLSKMREYRNLAELSQLAGAKGSADAGPQFLRGMGIARALISELRGDAAEVAHGRCETRQAKVPRAKRIAEAVGCFFRAAAGLASDSSDTFRAILSDLGGKLAGINQRLPHATAASAASTHQAQQTQRRREVALWQLQFCEYVMEELFAGVPEGALVFAEAALEHFRTAYGNPSDPVNARSPLAVAAAAAAAPAGVDPAAMLLQDPAEIVDDPAIREARLWGNIYFYCVDIRKYDRAYAALLANPLPASRLQNLRHLVHVLITEGRLQTLCALPFAGVVVVPASETTAAKDGAGSSGSQIDAQQAVESGFGSVSRRTVSLLSQVLDMLHRRTRELLESPQPYQVLYDFLVCRSDFKGAARAMTAYAWRLRSEGADTQATIAEALRAYELGISCLSQLPSDEAWLDLTDPWMKEHVKMRNMHHHVLGHMACSAVVEGGIATSAAAADGQLASAAAATFGCSGAERRDSGIASTLPADGDSGMVATLQSLKRERTLLFYSSMVAARVPGLRPLRQWDNEEAILQQLLLLGRYDGAQALVEGCGGGQGYGGAQWLKYMQLVVENLAEHCAVLQLKDGGLTPNGERPPRRRPDPAQDEFEGGGLGAASAAAVAATVGGRAAPLWGKLRNLLLEIVNRDRDVELNSGGLPVAWLLRDTAAKAVLSSDKRIDLPQWLQDMFLAPPGDSVAAAPASMGSWSCGPASLLALYVQHNRLPAAVELVCSQVDLWSNEDVLRRRQHCAAWMPYPQVELLRAKLVVSKQLNEQRFGALLEQLDVAMAAHVELVRMDTEGVKAYQIEGVDGSGGGSISEAAGGPALLMLQAPEAALSPAGGVPSPMFGVGVRGGLRLFG